MAYILLMIGGALGYLDYLGAANLKAAGALLRAEIFQYNPPFYKWVVAIVLVALVGYIPKMRPIATGMLTLIILAMVLQNSRESVVKSIIKSL